MFSTVIVGSWSNVLAIVKSFSFNAKGRPPIRPFCLATFKPAIVLSRIIERSNSAKEGMNYISNDMEHPTY